MKKFKFLFLTALIAVMLIGCAQSADDTMPIISTSEPEAQPTIVNVTVTKLYDLTDTDLVLSDSGTEIRVKSSPDPTYHIILDTSTPIGTYNNVFLPDEIELEYDNGEKKVVSIKRNLNFWVGTIEFNGLLDIFLNGLKISNISIEWTKLYKYK